MIWGTYLKHGPRIFDGHAVYNSPHKADAYLLAQFSFGLWLGG